MESRFRWRCLVLCICLAFFLGCAGLQSGSADLERRLEEVEDQILMLQASGVGASFRPYTALTGGGTGALDKTDGASLSDADVAVVVLEGDATYDNALLIYALDATSSCGGDDTGVHPRFIQPDTNAGTKCWELTSVYGVNVLGANKFFTFAANDTLTVEEVSGTMILVTAAAELELPDIGTAAGDAPQGSIFCVYVSAAVAVSLDPDASDSITMDGSEDTNGDKITSASAIADNVCLWASHSDGWTVPNNPTTWTAGGA